MPHNYYYVFFYYFCFRTLLVSKKFNLFFMLLFKNVLVHHVFWDKSLNMEAELTILLIAHLNCDVNQQKTASIIITLIFLLKCFWFIYNKFSPIELFDVLHHHCHGTLNRVCVYVSYWNKQTWKENRQTQKKRHIKLMY